MKKSLSCLFAALLGALSLTATMADDYTKRVHRIYPVAVDTPTQSYKQYDEPRTKPADKPAYTVAPVVTKTVKQPQQRLIIVKRVTTRTRDSWARSQIKKLWAVVGDGKSSKTAPAEQTVDPRVAAQQEVDSAFEVLRDSKLDPESKVKSPVAAAALRLGRVEKATIAAGDKADAAYKVGRLSIILVLVVLLIALFRDSMRDRAEDVVQRVRARRAATPAGP